MLSMTCEDCIVTTNMMLHGWVAKVLIASNILEHLIIIQGSWTSENQCYVTDWFTMSLLFPVLLFLVVRIRVDKHVKIVWPH